jgi:hypothetical protein
MRRTIGREVETPLATRILDGSLGLGDCVRLVGRGARVELERACSVDPEVATV